ATEAINKVPELASFPYYSWHHAIIVPDGHPLLDCRPITLEALAEYPVITYHEGFTGRAHVDAAFADAGVVPDIVLSAIDADVIKTYVGLGLGVGIVASVAYHPEQDRNLQLIEVPHLFPANTTHLAVRRGTYLRSYAHAFIEKVCPDLGEAALRAALKPAAAE
ncbi:MAG TPA: LysR substrate-binding domain-containing protein, partial [Azonexus sp.]|nr:LysR substrate-binding domain-containing protein [Azonexus sp.]